VLIKELPKIKEALVKEADDNVQVEEAVQPQPVKDYTTHAPDAD
jgi:hypothetical protein